MQKKWPMFFVFTLLFQGMWELQGQHDREPGIPFIHNYTREDYPANYQNWSTTQDHRGIMYFANSNTLLEFDGKYWNRIDLPGTIPVRSLGRYRKQIYAGGINEFGVLVFEQNGRSVYRSLSEKLPPADKNFGNIWGIHGTSHGIYFLSRKKIFRFYEGKLTTILKTTSSHSLQIGDAVLTATSEGTGVLTAHQFQLLPHINQVFPKAAGKILFLPYTDNKILIVIPSKGIFIYDLTPLLNHKGVFIDDFTKIKIPSTLIYPFKNEIASFLNDCNPYHAIKVNDDCYAFATVKNGVVLMNRQGQLIRVINKNAGLKDNSVWHLYCDRDQNVWAVLNDGIAYLELSSPIRLFNEKMNLNEIPISMIKHQKNLYVGTFSGIRWLPEYQVSSPKRTHGFLPVKNTSMECWDFTIFQNILLGGGNGAIYQIKGGAAKAQPLKGFLYSFGRSPRFPNHIFAGMRDRLIILTPDPVQQKTGQKKDFLKFKINYEHFKDIKCLIRRIVSDNNGDIWLCTLNNGIIYIRFTGPDISDFQIHYYNTSHGLPYNSLNYLHFFDNRIIIGSTRGIYQGIFPKDFAAHPEKMKFVPENTFGSSFPYPNREVGDMALDPWQNIWIQFFGGVGKFTREKEGGYTFSHIPFRKMLQGTNLPYIEKNGAFWNLNPRNIYRFDTKKSKNYQQDYNVMIRRVVLGEDSVLFHGNYGDPSQQVDSVSLIPTLEQPESRIPRLAYRHNTISFEYSAAFYEHAEDNHFKYILEGFDKDWSLWSSENDKEYTNLPEGDYCFRVKAKNIFEHEGREASYRFSVDPPWHRSGFAYTGYGFFFMAILYIGIWLNSRRLIAAKKHLEKIVTQRTEELQEKNEELQEKNTWITQQAAELQEKNAWITRQAAELQEKNGQIISSIQYAQTIQQAILPLKERLDASLPEYFILYRPRDIVSGDFYWFHEEKEKVMIAAIDCTGHGVPGAFMSMIGNTLLNDIVNELKESDPAKILEYLHLGVRTALKQNQPDSKNRDGMDVCLCVFDKHWQKLEFTGAKRPLFIVRNDAGNPVLREIKGDRKSIGGCQKEAQRTFTRQQIALQSGDRIYLTSDGFADQANPEGRKLGSKMLKALLKSSAHLPAAEQEKRFNETLDAHQGNAEQRDDITVIGIKIS